MTRRAILSVYDKTGLADLGQRLDARPQPIAVDREIVHIDWLAIEAPRGNHRALQCRGMSVATHIIDYPEALAIADYLRERDGVEVCKSFEATRGTCA